MNNLQDTMLSLAGSFRHPKTLKIKENSNETKADDNVSDSVLLQNSE